MEGIQDIDIGHLRKVARYEDGFSATHPLMKAFWEIVKDYTATEKQRLLEFVTASDRLPVGGIHNVLFVIQKNGSDSEVCAKPDNALE